MNTENAVECQFGNAIKELGICRMLKASNIRKKKGGNEESTLQFIRKGMSLEEALKMVG